MASSCRIEGVGRTLQEGGVLGLLLAGGCAVSCVGALHWPGVKNAWCFSDLAALVWTDDHRHCTLGTLPTLAPGSLCLPASSTSGCVLKRSQCRHRVPQNSCQQWCPLFLCTPVSLPNGHSSPAPQRVASCLPPDCGPANTAIQWQLHLLHRDLNPSHGEGTVFCFCLSLDWGYHVEFFYILDLLLNHCVVIPAVILFLFKSLCRFCLLIAPRPT